MSAKSRRKGHGFERETVNILKASGHHCARNLDQVRDGGGDIPFGDWLIECKRRAKIAIYEWWEQVTKASLLTNRVGHTIVKPLLVIRADNHESLVVMRLSDFIALLPTPDSAESRPSCVDGQS